MGFYAKDEYMLFHYNEKLFLDQVDHNFCEDQRNAERKFMKMNVVIQHSFSTKETQKTMAELKARYSIMIPDFVVYSQKTRIRRALCSIKVIGWGIREGIRNRQPLFIFWCIRELNNGQDISIKAKLNKIESRKELSDKFYKERLTSALIQECRVWTDERNNLIHHMANLPYDSEKVRQIAIDGNELVRQVKNKTASAINRLKREHKRPAEDS